MVLGFCFNQEKTKVALIKKKRPDWQKGFYNGVGGRVEKCDLTMFCTMERGFKEETGYTKKILWDNFGILNCPNVRIWLFRSTINDLNSLKTNTDEELKIFDVDKLPDNMVKPAKFIVFAALNENLKSIKIEYLVDKSK